MTYEDAAYIEPDLTIDMENKPSLWPYEDIDYVFEKLQKENEREKDKKKRKKEKKTDVIPFI